VFESVFDFRKLFTVTHKHKVSTHHPSVPVITRKGAAVYSSLIASLLMSCHTCDLRRPMCVCLRVGT